MKRRVFLETVLGALGAGAILGPAFLAGCSGRGGSVGTIAPPAVSPPTERPNILLVLMDEFRHPPSGYGPLEGELAPLKEILGFAEHVSDNNPYAPLFEGFMRLRRNAAVLRNHYIASAACVPSRTAMLTGQYSSLTGATSTDGIFKSGDQMAAAGLFLDPAGVPTLGDWFKAAGYDAKYFGKWHVSHEGDNQAPWDLSPWGFDCWTESGPEPHGANPANSGTMRDPGFMVNATNFLNGEGDCVPTPGKPWFAVSSFTNPHDIALYPIPFYLPQPNGVMAPLLPLSDPQPIPPQGTCVPNLAAVQPQQNPESTFPAECSGGPSVAMNPDGFPQASFGAVPTMDEDLSTKPSCHFDYSYKLGLALKSQLNANPVLQQLFPLPFQTQGAKAVPWMIAYGQFYTYLHYLSDLQLRQVLSALDAQGLTDNTIVVFTADHGEYAGAHGFMLEKWHSMYEEAVHVPFVVSSPLVNPLEDVLRQVEQATSHIDLAPTLLGLAGFTKVQVAEIQASITGHTPTSFVGTDLSPYIRGETNALIPGPDGLPRFGPLFMTDDEITAPIPGAPNANFQNFVLLVHQQIQGGVPLVPGPTRQPNHVRAITDGVWKFARYFDPDAKNADQWEMYYLPADPNEATNLLDFRTFEVRTTVGALTREQVEAQRDRMAAALRREESLMLKTASTPPGQTWTARTSGVSVTLRGVGFGGGQFVAVGDDGTLITSPDGITWTSRASGTGQDLLGATYGNGLYLAVGLSGTLLTSEDGISWTARASGTTKNLTYACFGDGLYVVTGDTGTIITSSDGVSWTARTSGATSNLEVAAFGNGTFVACGLNGTIVSSGDGLSWSVRASNTTEDLFGVSYGNGLFSAVGSAGTVVTSPDGAAWTAGSTGANAVLLGEAFGSGLFAAVGSLGTILTSPDTIIWTPHLSGTSGNLRMAAFGITQASVERFVTVGDAGRILSSP